MTCRNGRRASDSPDHDKSVNRFAFIDEQPFDTAAYEAELSQRTQRSHRRAYALVAIFFVVAAVGASIGSVVSRLN